MWQKKIYMKKSFITLVIDEKTSEVITGLMNLSCHRKVAEMLTVLNARREGVEFFMEFSKATHEAGWCKDPNCLVEAHKKSNEK